MSRSVRTTLVTAACMFAALVGVSSAQQKTTSTETKDFEVVAVSGNALVVRDAAATKEFIVPDTFRFKVGAKELSVHELTPGMKGTATITTTTTVTPVTVTEVKQATVMQATGNSVIVRGAQGIRMFSIGEINKRKMTILRGGKPVELSELREGDKLTATIVTEQPPKVMTEQDVKASIAAASVPAPCSGARCVTCGGVVPRESAVVATATPPPPTTTPASTPATAPTSAPAASPSTLPQATAVSVGISGGMLWAIGGIVALLAIVLFVWRSGS